MKHTVTLAGIAVRKRSKQPMISLSSAPVTCEHGVANDFRGKPGKRQVTVLSAQSWQQSCQALGQDIHWLDRRANLLIDGITFSAAHLGKVLKIGSAELLITRETDPCKRMDQLHPGLGEVLQSHWRGGVCCRVLKAGTIKLGDCVEILDEKARAPDAPVLS
jgi:MOSC domain-containing protein YiiM